MSEPQWLILARGEIGTHEIRGANDNPKIIAYRKEAGCGWVQGSEEAVAWCAIFVNAMLARAGIRGTRSPAAKSFCASRDFVELRAPAPGAITVIERNPPHPSLGHVPGPAGGLPRSHGHDAGAGSRGGDPRRDRARGRHRPARPPDRVEQPRRLPGQALMLKPASLAAALSGALPDLVHDPDRFQAYVDRGRILARATPALGFEYRYQLTLFVLDYAGDPDAILFPLLQWMRINQPEQLLNEQLRDDAIRFEADLLDQGRYNLSIEVQLSETVVVTAREAGGHDLTHLDEPGPIDGDPYALLEELWVERPPEAAAQILPDA